MFKIFSYQVVVVGGGWAGFGAASHLAASGVKVTLLEAQPSAGGLAAGWKTAKGNKYVSSNNNYRTVLVGALQVLTLFLFLVT